MLMTAMANMLNKEDGGRGAGDGTTKPAAGLGAHEVRVVLEECVMGTGLVSL